MPRTRVSKPLLLAALGIIAIVLAPFGVARLAQTTTSERRSASPGIPATGDVRAAEARDDYMLIDAARLASLPTSGRPYESMKRTADDAMAAMDLSEPASAASPWLPNYSDRSTGSGNAAAAVAAALVYARTGDVRYRDFVIKVNRFVIGSEDSASTNGTGSGDIALATMRQIGGYVLAADLVGMDQNVTGLRKGYTSTVWRTWLGQLRTKSIAPSGFRSIVANNMRASNWGAWASAARVTIDVYLNDTVDLAVAVDRLKLFLGESMSGSWSKTSSYDATWACLPSGSTVAFVPVNPSSCGPAKDGIIVEDASRSAFAFPKWDKMGTDYAFHAYSAQLLAAIVLDRKGYDVWNWGDRALKRIMDQLDRRGVATGNGRVTATHVSWIPRHFYGVNYPTVPAQPSDTLGYTDWLYGTAARIAISRLTRNTDTGTALIKVRVPAAGTLVLAGKGLRTLTKSPLQAGTVRMRLRPTVSTRSRLARSGRATVRARLRFLEPGSGSQVIVKAIELRARVTKKPGAAPHRG
jgi:hypothetical protein